MRRGPTTSLAATALRFLIRSESLYIVGDTLFAGSGSPQAAVRRVGSASTLIASLTRAALAASHVGPPLSFRGQILALQAQVDLVAGGLVPLLKFLDEDDDRCLELPGPLQTLLAELKEQAQLMTGGPSTEPPRREILAQALGQPCAILQGQIIPMKPARSWHRGSSVVVIGGQRYTLSRGSQRPLDDVISAIQRSCDVDRQRGVRPTRRRPPEPRDLMPTVERIFGFCRDGYAPGDRKVYEDRHHQIWFEPFLCLLIRGPILRRPGGGQLHVALPIHGRTRTEWLATPPLRVQSLSELRGPDGVMLKNRICMGNPSQFRRLLSDQYTDEEAVLQWLYAAELIAGGRCALHRRWRDHRGRGVPKGVRRPNLR